MASIFSHTRGTAMQRVGCTSLRVSTREPLSASAEALRDVRQGEVAHDVVVRVDAAQPPAGLRYVGEVVVRDHHALGRARGPGGVDERARVVGFDTRDARI